MSTEEREDAANTQWDPYAIVNTPQGETDNSPLLVMFHGYGADERDLLPVADLLPPQFTVASIRAPYKQGPGYTWYPLDPARPVDFDEVRPVLDRLIEWIEEQAREHVSVTLFGFSMGMAVATSILRRRPDLVDAVVGCSGFALNSDIDPTGTYFDDHGLKELNRPMFWGRDPQDPMIGQDHIEYTNTWAHNTVDLTKVAYEGIGHSIGAQEASHIGEFLDAQVLGAQI